MLFMLWDKNQNCKEVMTICPPLPTGSHIQHGGVLYEVSHYLVQLTEVDSVLGDDMHKAEIEVHCDEVK